jgi:hypothetical protein
LLLKQGRTPTAAGGWNAKGEVEELFDADDKTNEEKKKTTTEERAVVVVFRGFGSI